jgi:hypothetical protein
LFGENLILLGWYRFVCSNGLVIGESKIEIKERHKQGLELASIGCRLRQALASVDADRATMKKWQVEKVVIDDIATWADKRVSEHWGIKAAARVFHICDSAQDSETSRPAHVLRRNTTSPRPCPLSQPAGTTPRSG